MGSVSPSGNVLRFLSRLSHRVLGLPKGRPRTRRKGRRLLHQLLDRLFRREPDHVGRRRGNLPALEIHGKHQGHVGMVLRAEHPRGDLPQQRRLCSPLSSTRLGPRLCHHRNRHRNPSYLDLRGSLLPRLEQAQADEVHGHP